MAERPRLRWWQEETPNQPVQGASERLAPLPEPLAPSRERAASSIVTAEEADTWAELEAEAVCRMAQASAEEADSVSFFMNKPVILARHHFWVRFFQVCCGAYCVTGALLLSWFAYNQWVCLHWLNPYDYLALSLGWLVHGLPFCFLVPSKAQYRRLLVKQSPVLRLTSVGIFMERPLRKDEFFRWDVVAGVKACRLLKHRYLEIKTVKGRTITVEQNDLTAPVDTIAAQIEAYKTARDIA